MIFNTTSGFRETRESFFSNESEVTHKLQVKWKRIETEHFPLESPITTRLGRQKGAYGYISNKILPAPTCLLMTSPNDLQADFMAGHNRKFCLVSTT